MHLFYHLRTQWLWFLPFSPAPDLSQLITTWCSLFGSFKSFLPLEEPPWQMTWVSWVFLISSLLGVPKWQQQKISGHLLPGGVLHCPSHVWWHWPESPPLLLPQPSGQCPLRQQLDLLLEATRHLATLSHVPPDLLCDAVGNPPPWCTGLLLTNLFVTCVRATSLPWFSVTEKCYLIVNGSNLPAIYKTFSGIGLFDFQ